MWCKNTFSLSSVGGACTLAITCVFHKLVLVFRHVSLVMSNHIALFTAFVLRSTLKGHMLCIFIAFVFVTLVVNGLQGSHSSDEFASLWSQ